MSQRTGTIQSRERERDKFPIVFLNNSGETVPPHAIMQIQSVSGVPVDMAQLVTINKPNSTTSQYIVNGPLSVEDQKQGRARLASPLIIRFTGTTPVLGDDVGPSASSWAVSTSGSGYVALGGAEDGVVLCRPAGGGGSGTCIEVVTDITCVDGEFVVTKETIEVLSVGCMP